MSSSNPIYRPAWSKLDTQGRPTDITFIGRENIERIAVYGLSGPSVFVPYQLPRLLQRKQQIVRMYYASHLELGEISQEILGILKTYLTSLVTINHSVPGCTTDTLIPVTSFNGMSRKHITIVDISGDFDELPLGEQLNCVQRGRQFDAFITYDDRLKYGDQIGLIA